MNKSGKIIGTTKITGIFGYPVEHTLSPRMQNAAFEALGLDYCYVPFCVHPDMLEKAIVGVRAMNISGLNITVPHKEKVIPLLDEVQEEASFIGAVNTIVNIDGKLFGHNTDGRGFMEALREKGIFAEEKEVLLLGAGGAARAVGYYLCGAARRVAITARTLSKAEKLSQDLSRIKNNVEVLAEVSHLSSFDIIVNSTPLGLKDDDVLPIDVSLLHNRQTVCDLIYRETPLLKQAVRKGCRTMNGMGMLLWQGALAFEIWTGKKAPVEVMRSALLNAQ